MAKVIPQRKCIGCSEMKGKNELIRIIKDKDGNISLDKTGKMNGRGAYICNNSECLKKARKCKGLERAFQMAINSEIYDSLEKEYMN